MDKKKPDAFDKACDKALEGKSPEELKKIGDAMAKAMAILEKAMKK